MDVQTATKYLQTIPGFKFSLYSPDKYPELKGNVSLSFNLVDGTYYATIPDTENRVNDLIRVATEIKRSQEAMG